MSSVESKKSKPRSPARTTKKACKKITKQFKPEMDDEPIVVEEDVEITPTEVVDDINININTFDNKDAIGGCARVDNNVLKPLGYQPIRTIGLKSKDDDLIYVKSINRLGQTVYVLLDDKNHINCDVTLVESDAHPSI